MQRISAILLGITLPALCQSASAQPYTLKAGEVVQHAIDASSSVYRVRGVQAQIVGSKMTGGVYTVYPGTLGVMINVPDFCPGDLNDDGSTDLQDFNLFGVRFGDSGIEPFTGGDLNGDGVVDLADFNILGTNFGCSS